MLGAAALLACDLLDWRDALHAIAKGSDVYLFLIGMMLLSELARQEGLFDHVAARAVRMARGSASRLFALVYGVGIVVTVFLSNDATAVVLTPAVYAAARAAKAEPLPYLLVCAFIANAASFVLPISNPANLVMFAGHMPPLLAWLEQFALPSLLAVAITFAVLRATQIRSLSAEIVADVAIPPLSATGRWAAWGLFATALGLLLASSRGAALGLPTCAAGVLSTGAVTLHARKPPWKMLAAVSWMVLPLVAGLFVLVAALDHTGVTARLSDLLRAHGRIGFGPGIAVAVATNLINNLPAGLIAASVAATAQVPQAVTGALLIGVDLGPNLSITGSLATILWLAALRREGQHVGAWQFLKLGALVMPPALLAALIGLWAASP